MKLPDLKIIFEIIEGLKILVFPEHFNGKLSKRQIKKKLLKQLEKDVCEELLSKLPEIKQMIHKDAQAIFDGDPAANSLDEIILCYPGLFAIFVYRLAHVLYELKVTYIPRIMTEYAHSKTGIDIHAGADIGEYFCIDHGTGIVIGETTKIGKHVKLYQGVTLGALSTRKGQELKNIKRHPTIENNVTIYANATILGGDTVIGQNSTVGGNAFIVQSIPKDSKIAGNFKDIV